MNQADREVLIRVDERTRDIPAIKQKVDAIHGLQTSVVWLTWGMRGLYTAAVGAVISMAVAG